MTSSIIEKWPALLAPRQITFSMAGMTVQGTPSLSGLAQTVSYDAGFWRATYSGTPVGGSSKVRAYRAFLARMEGGSYPVRVPVFDDAQKPYPNPGGAAGNPATSQPYSDTKFHTDGHGFLQRAIDVALETDAALRDTTVRVTINDAEDPLVDPGFFFSIGDRLYLVKQIDDVDADTQDWRFWPPLRGASAAGQHLNLDDPVCKMKLESEAEGRLALERGLYGYTEINWVEVPDVPVDA